MGTPATPVCAGEANKETNIRIGIILVLNTHKSLQNWEEFAPEWWQLILN